MDTKALRKKILELAIRGKLVPQDPNDEPAFILLERIHEQKRQMVKDGKLKAKDIENDTIIFVGEDNLHYERFYDGMVKCIEDEIPFEVPKGWAWCRLPIIATDIFAGGDKPEVYSKNRSETCNIPIYSNGIDNDGLYGYTNVARVTEPSITISARGTIGFCCVRKTPFVPIVRLITITPYRGIDLYYLKTVFEALIEIGEGSSIPQLTVPGIKPKLIPIPPIMEQGKIQSKLDEILELISGISFEKEELRRMVQQAKSKILDLAIRGKIVPQDPDDEHASILLERIRTEKQELIKQGKIKRDKRESIIFKGDDNSYYEKIGDKIHCINDEIPFDLPARWNWTRLKSICSKIIDGSHNPPKGLDVSTSFIMASSRNIMFDAIFDLENVRYLCENDFEKENSRINLEIGDILLTTVATLGRSCIYNGFPEKLCFQRSVTIISTDILPQYLKLFFDAPYFQGIIMNGATGTAQKGFYLNQLEGVLICVPPLIEQKRIIKKSECILSKLFCVEKSLN